MEDVTFFGPVDKKEGKPEGRVTSEYPAWMHKIAIEDLTEEIARMEREIERGAIPSDQIARQKELLKSRKAKMEVIEASRPELNDKQKDELANEYKRLGKEVQGYMYSRSEMMMGTASAHEEAERMITPSITVSPEIARMCNLKAVGGKVSRNDASRAFKMIGSLIGEPTNAEVLRRDNVTTRTGGVGRPKKEG